MIVDASALLAILLNEPEAERFADRLAAVERSRISIANDFKVAVRIDRLDSPLAVPRFDAFIDMAASRIEPVTVGQGRLARWSSPNAARGDTAPASISATASPVHWLRKPACLCCSKARALP